jgi:hypothetical protein
MSILISTPSSPDDHLLSADLDNAVHYLLLSPF